MNKQTDVNSALRDVRAAVQELHGALSDAASKRGGAVKADLELIPLKAKAVSDSLRNSMGTQSEAAKKSLTEAAKYLEAMQKHAAESVKSSGQVFQTSVRQAIADARAAAQKVSEAVAETRSTVSKKSAK